MPKIKDQAALAAHNERTERMASMYRQGVTLEKIGQQFGISRQRVNQLLKRVGINKDSGGASVPARHKHQKKEASLHARFMAKYGQPPEVVRELQKARITHAYSQQRQSASNRGIDWNLDFASWFSIWKTSGKLHLRGKGKGKYVMSRIRDDGAYELGNVHIQLATENSREAVEKWRGKVKENRGVFLLYPGRAKAWMATYKRKSVGFFETEQEAVAARLSAMNADPEGGRPNGAKGWTYRPEARYAAKPYYMQCAGTKSKGFATQAEAEAAYKAAVAERIAARKQVAEGVKSSGVGGLEHNPTVVFFA